MKYITTENRANVENEFKLVSYIKGEAFIQPGHDLSKDELKEVLCSGWDYAIDLEFDITYSLNGNSVHMAC